MGALKIECYCNEGQMESIVMLVYKRIYQMSGHDIDDIDELYGELRICVDFEQYTGSLMVQTAEILNSDWDLLHEDSAVLTSRLKPIVNEYNRRQKEILKQNCGMFDY